MFLSSLLFSAGLLFSRGQSLPIDGTPTVSTTSGTLQGLSSNNVNIFLGVPYAQPPIGDLRWKPAVPVNDSTIPVNATQFGPGCGQLQVPGYGSVYADVGIIPPPKIQSEDCLSLNVWTPRNAEKLPVLIFIHGGAYQTGSSDNVAYGGDHLASTGRAIVVSIQYRLNIWGYPSTTAVDGLTQNVGTTDARLALEWVSDNIASFGGDPERIVVSGHSAGASLTDSLLYAYKENPIAAGVIIASAAVGTIAAAPTDGELWNLVSDSLGCGNTTNTDQISCMRKVPFQSINNATLQLMTYFGPTSDGSVIFTNDEYLSRGAKGTFAHVPTLLSNVNDEGSLFIEPYSSIYPNGTTADSVANIMVCPIATDALDTSRIGVPTWRSRYFAIWDDLSPFPNDPSVGAYHGSDILLAFGTYDEAKIGNGTSSEAERDLSSRLMDAWLTFVENPQDGLSKRLGWPVYDANGDTLVKIGENNSSSITFGPSTGYDSTCPQ